MKEILLSPHAASLSQSMRDLGYSLEAAIADLIDNSITASAENIWIFLEIKDTEEAYLVIIDDGSGMTNDELLEAMRPGSRNPRERRDADDLGRFGLGLKTASFSQCKSLTVVSRKNRDLVAAQWDLDLIASRNEWIVTVPATDEIGNMPYLDRLGSHGTYILWQKLDRLLENSGPERSRTDAYDKLSIVEKHLALVFHRYLSGDYKKWKIAIHINGHPIIAFDPFCLSNRATQLLQEEIIRIAGHEIRIQPYILPHHSKLSRKEYDLYRDFVSNQGAYVYRNGRLIAWGDWFRLIPKSEATKLARIRIDFPNSLDELWTIDIKKSRAHPPHQVREKLRQIIARIADKSRRVHSGRGDRLFEDHEQPLWNRYSDREGIRYGIDRDHIMITAFLNGLSPDSAKAFETILSVVERSIPLEAIYADYSSGPQLFEEEDEMMHDELKEKLENIYSLILSSGPVDKESFVRMILGLKPFSKNSDLTLRLIEELV